MHFMNRYLPSHRQVDPTGEALIAAHGLDDALTFKARGPMSSDVNYPPVSVTVVGSKGYVWEAEGVRWLRQQCRIVGGMIGTSAEPKQQKAAGGLPCELNAEELALAVHKGWVTIVHSSPSNADGVLVSPSAVGFPAPAWLTAVLNKRSISLTISATRQPSSGVDAATCIGTSNTINNKSAVFLSLHGSGYFVTDGSKFGADYLLYPGDPLLYHAQFTVRVLQHQTAIKPALLIGAARGSHSARKHLLLASVGPATLSYITVAPESGFGSTG